MTLEVTETDWYAFGPHGKVCSSCGTKYPKCSTYFDRDESAPDGLDRECKECRSVNDARQFAARAAAR
jgi:hypothetical protein